MDLYWELTVLVRAVPYRNLTDASSRIGMSQPQLSRVISKLERELGMVLLDRTIRRKSGWLPQAQQLAEIFRKSQRQLDSEIQKLMGFQQMQHLRVGTLEGIATLASQICHSVLKRTSTQSIELDIHDLNELEETFLRGELDLIFTQREPSRRKYSLQMELGFQLLEQVRGNSSIQVLSLFEFTQSGLKQPHKERKQLISNSLYIRRLWMEKFEASGINPSPVLRESKSSASERVLLIGQETLAVSHWKKIIALH